MIEASAPSGGPLRDPPVSSKAEDCQIEEMFSAIIAMNRSLATFRELPVFKNERLEAVQWLVLMAISRRPITKPRQLYDLLGILPHRVQQILHSLKEGHLIEGFSPDGPHPTRIVPTDVGSNVLARVNEALASLNNSPIKKFSADFGSLHRLFAFRKKK
jgi:DNA-binding MarR family transcriptional regulator